MNIISKENVQEMDPDAGQAMEMNDEASDATSDIFGNSVILKNQILEQFPDSKLLELSLVSKFWKKEARMVMKKRGNAMAFLKCDGVRGCGQVFVDFAANLETLNEALYSGMTIRLYPRTDCEGSGSLEVEAIHESILAGMRGKVKRLSIRLDYGRPLACWKNAQNCPNFRLLRLLLRDFFGDLEHFTLRVDVMMKPFVQQFIPLGPYPKLKVLKLEDVCLFYFNQETFSNQVRMLLSRAPNLQEVHTRGRVSLRENMMEGREGVVHVHEAFVCNPMQEISKNVIPALRLKRADFFYTTEAELNLDRFNVKAQSLLRTCCATTLEFLNLDRVSAFLLMSYGIPLVNVKELTIGLDYVQSEQFEPRIISILSRFDFNYLFPNLKKVDINILYCSPFGESSRDTIDGIFEQANAVRREPTLHQVGTIKELVLYQHSISAFAVQFFADMFPNIEGLDVKSRDEAFPVGTAWELWPDLKRMKVNRRWYQRP